MDSSAAAFPASILSRLPGGIPDAVDDNVWTIGFLMVFLTSAAINALLLRANIKRNRRFPLLALAIGYGVMRTVTMCFRLAWTYHPLNRPLATVAAVLVASGAALLYVINLFLAQRILRSRRPEIGWSTSATVIFGSFLLLLPLILIMLITVLVHSIHTSDPGSTRVDRPLQQAGAVYLLWFAFLPIPISILATLLPARGEADEFGRGRWQSKTYLVMTASLLLTTNAVFRVVTVFLPLNQVEGDRWWRAKWSFYVFNFALEAIVVYTFIIFRIDQRFNIPSQCRKSGDYSRREKLALNQDDDNTTILSLDTKTGRYSQMMVQTWHEERLAGSVKSAQDTSICLYCVCSDVESVISKPTG